MVTQPFTPSLIAAVDISAPQVVALGDTLPFYPIWFENRRVILDWQTNYPSWVNHRRRASERSWYYTAMDAQYWTFPDLFVDSDLTNHRVIPWPAYKYGLVGYLHWGTAAAYRGDTTPWEDQRIWWTNGDGTLLYPAFPSEHNVFRHRAAPSLRLIGLREGIDDFEYLELPEDVRGRSVARRLTDRVVRSSVSFGRSERHYGEVRDTVARRIARALRAR